MYYVKVIFNTICIHTLLTSDLGGSTFENQTRKSFTFIQNILFVLQSHNPSRVFATIYQLLLDRPNLLQPVFRDHSLGAASSASIQRIIGLALISAGLQPTCLLILFFSWHSELIDSLLHHDIAKKSYTLRVQPSIIKDICLTDIEFFKNFL